METAGVDVDEILVDTDVLMLLAVDTVDPGSVRVLVDVDADAAHDGGGAGDGEG